MPPDDALPVDFGRSADAGPEEESRRGDLMADRGVVLPALRGEAGGGAEAGRGVVAGSVAEGGRLATL